MSRTLFTVIGSGLFMAVTQLSAQAPTPPKVLHIIREDLKEGKGGPHEKAEARIAQFFARSKFPGHYLGMTTVTGPMQAWFLEPHDSFASLEETIAAQEKLSEFETLDAVDSEYRTSTRGILAVYRADLSYHGTQLMEAMPKTRFFNIITIRIRFEHDQEFAELAKKAITAADKSESDQPVAVYQVVSGMPAGTYMLLEPAASLKALDDASARSRALMQAMGESGYKQFLKGAAETIANEESLLFELNPRMSYVPKDFAAGDPEFWTPKPAKAAAKPKAAEKASAAK